MHEGLSNTDSHSASKIGSRSAPTRCTHCVSVGSARSRAYRGSGSGPRRPPLVYYEQARVVVDGQAVASGSLAMTFTPQGGQRQSITVNVLLETKKKDVARDIHKELSIVAGPAYKVKVDNEKIRISKVDRKQTPNFALSVDRLEVGGVSVRVEKD